CCCRTRAGARSRAARRARWRRSCARRASTTPPRCIDGGVDAQAAARTPMTDLVGAPLGALLRRMLLEHEREGKVFDLPARKFWHGAPDLDTSVLFHGRRAAAPLGPAAGPQDQMAQNIVLSWLGGSRILELKTIQVNDRLVLPRPCIDATTVGYNVEWSQELRLEDSLREYVTGSMLLDVLKAENLLGLPSDRLKQDTILDMSVGYDLAGIRSPQVHA